MLYKPESQESILNYSKKLKNQTLTQVCSFDDSTNLFKGKGNFGQVLEKFYYGYNPNSNSNADFPEANLELKTSSLKILKNGTINSKERLVLNIINYLTLVDEKFEDSTFLKKNKNLLLIFYLHEHDKFFLDYVIKLVDIWKLDDQDLQIIKNDWKIIQEKVIAGNAHELSEGDTFYLGAATKGSKGGNLRNQPYSDIQAKQRAFSFKQGYVNHIIASFANNEKEKFGKIIKQNSVLSLEEIVYNKFSIFYGMNIDDILNCFENQLNKKAKSFYANLTKLILGLKTDEKIEEFTKSDIIVKTVRLKVNGVPKEDISFPTFKYKEIIKETWEESDFKLILEKKFFFVFYQYDENDNLKLKGVKFWNMSYGDVLEVKKMWEETIYRINNKQSNCLPRKSEHRIAHVRPHAKNKMDTYETPEGTNEVKKCFWLNSKYIKSIFKVNK